MSVIKIEKRKKGHKEEVLEKNEEKKQQMSEENRQRDKGKSIKRKGKIETYNLEAIHTHLKRPLCGLCVQVHVSVSHCVCVCSCVAVGVKQP